MSCAETPNVKLHRKCRWNNLIVKWIISDKCIYMNIEEIIVHLWQNVLQKWTWKHWRELRIFFKHYFLFAIAILEKMGLSFLIQVIFKIWNSFIIFTKSNLFLDIRLRLFEFKHFWYFWWSKVFFPYRDWTWIFNYNCIIIISINISNKFSVKSNETEAKKSKIRISMNFY